MKISNWQRYLTLISLILSAVILSLTAQPVHAQGPDWTWQNPLPTGNRLDDVWGSSGSDIFATGWHGTILHYDGSSWTAMSSGTTNQLEGVWGSSGSDVFAVGSYGTILHYDGSSWTAMSSGTPNHLWGVWGSSGSDVFAVGSGETVLHYDGSSWTTMSSGMITNGLTDVWGSSGSDVFAVGGNGTILHYDGSSWSAMNSGTTNYLEGVWGRSSSDVFAVGEGGTILHYDGSGWTAMSSGTTERLYGVWGSSGSDVFAVRGNGIILHYDGSSWTAMSSGTTEWFYDVWGSANSDVFVVGSYGTILHYDGSSWTAMGSGTTNELVDVWGSSGSDVFTVGRYGTILHYYGNSWTAMSSGTTNRLNGVWGSSDSDIFAVGAYGTVLHYDGSSWMAMSSDTTNHFWGVWGSSGSDVFAVGAYGTVLHYDGSSWMAMSSGTTNHLGDIWGSSGSDVFAVGHRGTILHYDGSSWTAMSSGTPYDLRGVWGSSGDNVFVVGSLGTILHYDGSSWTPMSSGTTNRLQGVWGNSGSDVFAVGAYGTVLHYDGSSWTAMSSGTPYDLGDVWGSSGNDVFAVGWRGAILHYGSSSSPSPLIRITLSNLQKDTSSLSSQYVITNTTTSLANVAHNFYDSADNLVTMELDTIPGNSSQTYDLASIAGLPDGYAGYVVIQSDQQITGAVLAPSTPTPIPTPGPNDLIKVPLRWCWMEGSSAVVNPSNVGVSSKERVLLDRLVKVDRNIFKPQAKITFLEGVVQNTIPVLQIPVISDPNPPPPQGTGPGELGDIVYAADGSGEISDALQNCRVAWQNLAPEVKGIPVVNLNRLIDSQGRFVYRDANNAWQYANGGIFGVTMHPSDVGNDPVSWLLGNGVVVNDNAYHMPGSPLFETAYGGLSGLFPRLQLKDTKEKILGHELGHTLGLLHGNGVDNDQDGTLDDADENDPVGGTNLMQKGTLLGDPGASVGDVNLTAVQVTRTRNFASRFPGVMINSQASTSSELATIFASGFLGDTKVDVLGDVPQNEAFVDLEAVAVSEDQQATTTTFAASTSGVLPDNISGLHYLFVMDLDDNFSTGGAPGDIGIPTTVQGIELVGKVSVNVSNRTAQQVVTVWKFQSGQFVEISDPAIQARIVPINMSSFCLYCDADSIHVGDAIQLVIPNSVRGSMANRFSLQALAQNSNTGTIDDASVTMILDSPTSPQCQVSPSKVVPGASVTVDAVGFAPNITATVSISGQQLVSGTTDSIGSISANVAIPDETASGQQLVQVDNTGSQIAANCIVEVIGPPEFEIPPSPQNGSILTVTANNVLSFTVLASDANIDDKVALGASNLPLGANFAVPSPANLIDATFVWTPTTNEVGNYEVGFTAVDDSGLTASPLSVTIEVHSSSNGVYLPIIVK